MSARPTIARIVGEGLGFVAGPPLRDARYLALHRVLSERPWSGVAAEALAALALREQVAVLASALAPGLAPYLEEAVTRLRRIDAALELGLTQAGRALDGLGPVALLKGSAAAAWVYPETAQRQRRDLDLLVGERLPEARERLLAHGWRDANDPRHGQDPRRVRAWNMALELGGGRVSLDLHRDLVHRPWCRPDVARMLARGVEGRACLPVTDPADTFVTTAIHLLGTGFHEPLKGWIDCLRLLPLVAPDALAARARSHGLWAGTWLVLGVLGRWFEAQAHVAPYRAAIGRPPQGALLDYLAAGEHATPERRPLPRGVAYRLWTRLVRDLRVIDSARGPT